MSHSQVNGLPVVMFQVSLSAKSDRISVREMAKEMEMENGSESKTIHTSVQRIPKVLVKPLQSAGMAIRTHFKTYGIQLGAEIGIPIAILPRFKAKLEELKHEFEVQKENLVRLAEDGTMQRMSEAALADVKDKYAVAIPSASEIRAGFGYEIISAANFESPAVKKAFDLLETGFKDSVRQEIETSMKNDIDRQMQESSRVIRAKVLATLNTVINKAGKADIKGVHFKTIVKSICQLVEEMPNYNLTNDPEITKLLETVRKQFDGTNHEILRIDPKAREAVVEKAKTVKKNFAKMFED